MDLSILEFQFGGQHLEFSKCSRQEMLECLQIDRPLLSYHPYTGLIKELKDHLREISLALRKMELTRWIILIIVRPTRPQVRRF